MPASGWCMLLFLILTFGCEFPALGKHAPKTDAPVEKEKWGIGVLLVMIGLRSKIKWHSGLCREQATFRRFCDLIKCFIAIGC